MRTTMDRFTARARRALRSWADRSPAAARTQSGRSRSPNPTRVTDRQEAGPPGKKASKKKPYSLRSAEGVGDAATFVRDQLVTADHQRVLERIRRRFADGRPPRVAFVVSEAEKWSGASLVREMLERGWDLTFPLYPMERKKTTKEELAAEVARQVDLFEELGVPVTSHLDSAAGSRTPIEDLDVDIAFVQQPWGGLQDAPRRAVGRFLTAYIHYGYMLTANDDMHYSMPGFHPYIWRFYEQSELHRRMHIECEPGVADRIQVVNYPKLDVYAEQDPPWRAERPTVIFAPHHSLGPRSLRMGTFDWSADAVLELAESRSDFNWVYKPHPKLEYSLLHDRGWSSEQYRSYQRRWESVGSIYAGGAYFDHFRTSSAIVTDCGSFLAEYLPTGRPVLWLRAPEPVGFNRAGNRIADVLYGISDPGELRTTFDRVLRDGHDDLAASRRQISHELVFDGNESAHQVVDDLMATFT